MVIFQRYRKIANQTQTEIEAQGLNRPRTIWIPDYKIFKFNF